MSVSEQMKDMLSPLGIYSLDENSLVAYELKVYAAELEKLHDKLNELLRECFISTAESYGTDKFEELFAYSRPDLSIQERRALTGRYMTLNNTDFSEESVKGQLRLAGASDNFIQDSENERLIFPDVAATSDITNAAKHLSIILSTVPAHLDVDVGIGAKEWDEWDGLEMNFGTLDRMDLRFDLFDE